LRKYTTKNTYFPHRKYIRSLRTFVWPHHYVSWGRTSHVVYVKPALLDVHV